MPPGEMPHQEGTRRSGSPVAPVTSFSHAFGSVLAFNVLFRGAAIAEPGFVLGLHRRLQRIQWRLRLFVSDGDRFLDGFAEDAHGHPMELASPLGRAMAEARAAWALPDDVPLDPERRVGASTSGRSRWVSVAAKPRR